MSANAAHFDDNQVPTIMGAIGTAGTADTAGTARPLPIGVNPDTGAMYVHDLAGASGTTNVNFSSGTGLVILNAFNSADNTTTATLPAGGTFTGTAVQNVYPDLMVSCFTDQIGTLYNDFSVDGTNFTTFPSAGFSVSANIHEFHTAVKGPRHHRTRYINGSGSQSTFRLYTYYGDFEKANAPLSQAITNDADAENVRAIIAGSSTAGGGSYVNVKVNPSGAVQIGGVLDGFSTGTITTIAAGSVQTNPVPVPQMLSLGTLGTAGGSLFATVSAASGAGTKHYVSGVDIVMQSGTADVRVLAGTSIQGTGVLVAGALAANGGISKQFVPAFNTGTNSELTYHFVGAGTAFITVNYWKGT